VCVVDNLANGVQGEALTTAGFDAGTVANQARDRRNSLAGSYPRWPERRVVTVLRPRSTTTEEQPVKTEILYSPAFAAAKVTLDQGESVKAEGGAMLAMSASVGIETSAQGGMLKGLRRKVLGGESFFMNTFTANGPGAEVYFAPTLAGGRRGLAAPGAERVPAVGRVPRVGVDRRHRHPVGRIQDVLQPAATSSC